MRKIKGVNNLAAIMLMVLVFDYNLGGNLISEKEFVAANFSERIEMLKLRFEQNLIDYKEILITRLEIGAYKGEEQKELFEEMILISEAIEATCNKKKGKRAEKAVLFKCFLHSDSNPSMSWSATQHGFYCFSCGKKNRVFDLFDYLRFIYKFSGATAFKNSFRIAVDSYIEYGNKIVNPYLERKNSIKHTNFIPYSKEMNKLRFWTFHHQIEGDIPALEKLKERGISAVTAKRMSVMTWYPTTDNKPWGLCYWIFPNDDGSYTRRLATINKSMNTGEHARKWWNPVGKTMGIFNTRVLDHCRQFKEVCFVTESAIDAMSCEELGYHAIGLNSINNQSKFFAEYIDNHPDILLVCLTDNDEAGTDAVDDFIKRGLFLPDYLQKEYLGDRWLSKFSDINEALVADRKETSWELQKLDKEAKEFYKKGI